ncbi:hypothetical protein [Spirosoma linguale]|uniref:hypothetical protein n=1 Tax=Spirosoma linguale TaxID=108 RepID=UPI0001A3AC07
MRVFIEDQRPDEWVAGYSINANAPYRYLSAHSEEQQKAMLEQAGIPANDIIEIGTIWMNLAALGKKGRWQIYQVMMGDAYATNRSFILGGTVHRRIRDFQMQVVKNLLFDGDVLLGAKKQHVWLYYTHRDELWFDFFRATIQEFRGGDPDAYSSSQAA